MMTPSNEPRTTKTFATPLPIKGIRKEVVSHFKVQYTFGDFILNSTRVLFHKEKQISVSPKELGVLILLLESAGELVTKDRIIDEVWSGANVAEESLTRCIYVLRRILQEGKHNRYIDTVYGKGYRFSLPVTRITPAERLATTAANRTVAIFPFTMGNGYLDALSLHDALVDDMSDYASCGLHILPSSLTMNCRTVESMLALIEKIRPDYYLAGHELILANQPSLRIEFIRAHDHYVLHREGITLTAALTHGCIKNQLNPLILKYIPGLKAERSQTAMPECKPDAAACLQEGRNAFLEYTPESLTKALGLFQGCLQQMPDDADLYCHLAECYFALGKMGMMGLEPAMKACGNMVDQVLARQPEHPLALAMGGVLHGLNAEFSQAAELFRQALTTAKENPLVNYYYAVHLFIVGEVARALHFARLADQLQPGMIASLALILWLEYCQGNASAALKVTDRQSGAAVEHPVLMSMNAVILCGEGRPSCALKLVDRLQPGDKPEGIIYLNTLYTRLFAQSTVVDADRVAQIVEQSAHKMHSALLPVILQCHGLNEAKKWYDHLANSSSPCLRFWRHDPRVKSLNAATGAVATS